MAFREREAVTVMIDIARFTSAVSGMDSLEIADVLERVNAQLSGAVSNHGGRIVKYLGDGCLAVFPADASLAALDAVAEMVDAVRHVGGELGLALDLGANVHLCNIAEGEFGADGFYDIIGAGVMHTFRMGAGAGVRISEPVYRKLPSDRRAAWTKHQPPATYTLTA
jgi:adenylate cyclase